MGPRAGMDVVEKRKTSCLHWDANPIPSSPWLGDHTKYAIPTPILHLNEPPLFYLTNYSVDFSLQAKFLPNLLHNFRDEKFGSTATFPIGLIYTVRQIQK